MIIKKHTYKDHVLDIHQPTFFHGINQLKSFNVKKINDNTYEYYYPETNLGKGIYTTLGAAPGVAIGGFIGGLAGSAGSILGGDPDILVPTGVDIGGSLGGVLGGNYMANKYNSIVRSPIVTETIVDVK